MKCTWPTQAPMQPIFHWLALGGVLSVQGFAFGVQGFVLGVRGFFDIIMLVSASRKSSAGG